MNKPSYIVKRSERTHNGALFTSTIQKIKGSLLARGFVLLPSDTCYSVAMLAIDARVRTTLNNLLNRVNEPISLAFPNILKLEEFVELNQVSANLFEMFTPGPLTVVCNASPKVPIELTSQIIGTDNRTIGARIPDSIVERDIASCTKYPITTVAVRDPKDNKAVKNFEQAIEIVGKGMRYLENTIWGTAIEGGDFYASHSTVIRVTDGLEKVALLREGDIPFEEIQSVSSNMPVWAIEDWT